MKTVGYSMIVRVVIAAVMGLSIHAQASNDVTIGIIKTMAEKTVVVTEGKERLVKVGGPIFLGDSIVTKKYGSLGVIFKDGAVMSVGPNSRVHINEFVFNPAEKQVGFSSKIYKGALSFVSGAIGRIAPEKVRIETPTATLGLRGTKILVEVQ